MILPFNVVDRIISPRFLALVLALYFAFHILYFFLPSVPLESDSLSYYRWAQENLKSGTLYPSSYNLSLNKECVVAPVYINLLVVTLSIWNDPKAIFVLNAVFNISQLLLVFALTRKIFGELPAAFAAGLYIFYMNNLGLLQMNLTELAFGVFLLLSIFLYITRRGAGALLFSGFFLGLAIGVRPTGWALVLALILVLVWKAFHGTREIRKPILAAFGLCIYILGAGLYTQHSIGDFVFMSDSGPANLILSCNDEANGLYSDKIFKRPEFQIENYKERSKAYLSYSIRWIRQHPFQWISQFPQKIYSTYITDDFSVSRLLLQEEWSFNRFVKALRRGELNQRFNNEPLWFRVSFLILNIFHQLFYMTLVAVFAMQTFQFIKNKEWKEGTILLYLYVLIGVLMTLVGSIGSLRYKYSYMIIAMILCSPLIAQFIRKHSIPLHPSD